MPRINIQNQISMTEADKEKAIRCIVSVVIKSFAHGFSARHFSEGENEDEVISLKSSELDASALNPEFRFYSELSSQQEQSLDELLEIIAEGIAMLNCSKNQQADNLVSQLLGKERPSMGPDFWNNICKLENGYDIIFGEFRKNVHYINEALNEITPECHAE